MDKINLQIELQAFSLAQTQFFNDPYNFPSEVNMEMALNEYFGHRTSGKIAMIGSCGIGKTTLAEHVIQMTEHKFIQPMEALKSKAELACKAMQKITLSLRELTPIETPKNLTKKASVVNKGYNNKYARRYHSRKH